MNMNKIKMLAGSWMAICMFWAGSACAAPWLRSGGDTSTPRTLLWKITGNGLKKPSYLFGTMHILCADEARLSKTLVQSIRDCDLVYFEIKLDDIAALVKSMQYMQMKGGKKLSDLLTESEYQKVKKYFEAHSSPLLPFSLLERFKPLLISSLIEEEGMDCKTTQMELLIMKEAQAWDKRIQGLETASFQAGLFDSIPYEKQAKDLLNYIDSLPQYKNMTNGLSKAYHDQDLDKIDDLTQTGDPGIGNYLDLLLYGRNRKWVEELDSLMQERSLLVAVGAGHLPGTQGVINLLREKGYTLTPMKN
jgi:uncharacterized protein YbaP (TraB family)